MYGIKNNKISGNARIVATLPLLAINITAKEDDLFDHCKHEDDFIRFCLHERSFPDDFNNTFVLFKGTWRGKNQEIMGANLLERNPLTVINIVIEPNLLLGPRFQRIKNKSGFIKFHILENEDPSNEGDFVIHPGHFNYVHKHDREL